MENFPTPDLRHVCLGLLTPPPYFFLTKIVPVSAGVMCFLSFFFFENLSVKLLMITGCVERMIQLKWFCSIFHPTCSVSGPISSLSKLSVNSAFYYITCWLSLHIIQLSIHKIHRVNLVAVYFKYMHGSSLLISQFMPFIHATSYFQNFVAACFVLYISFSSISTTFIGWYFSNPG